MNTKNTSAGWVLRHYFETLRKNPDSRKELIVLLAAIAGTWAIVILMGVLKDNGVW